MRRLAIFVSIFLLSLSLISRAEDGSVPKCADTEFAQFFNMIVAHQTEFDSAITSASMLNRVSRAQMERREGYQADLPLCADAIAIQRLLIQLGGDALGRAALDLADLPADDNPYLRRLPSDQSQIEGLLSTMIAIDRSDAKPAQERELAACERDDWRPLDDAAAAVLDATDSTSDASSPAAALIEIDRLLLWRETTIPSLPKCAESINLIQALSAAATDAAAYQAFTYGGVSPERNPFPPLLEKSIAIVTDWRETFPHASASNSGAYIDKPLPSCPPAELSGAFSELQAEYAAIIERAEAAESSADLLDFGAAQVAFRARRLAELPQCAEGFELSWQAAEALADAALRSAIALGAPASIGAGREARMNLNAARAASSWGALDRASGQAETATTTSSNSGSFAPAPRCGDGELIFLFSYLLPEFWQLTDAALMLTQPEEAAGFIDRSYAFRQLLWSYLPRCDDALEMGLLMRAVAADAAAMIALELAGAAVADGPYLLKMAGDLKRLFEQTEQFNASCSGVNGATSTYYVVAENIANIRSCASTSCAIATTAYRGQRLDVVDDQSNWYEIVLPSCETAFIAGFLASKTPPTR